MFKVAKSGTIAEPTAGSLNLGIVPPGLATAPAPAIIPATTPGPCDMVSLYEGGSCPTGDICG